MTRKGRGLLIAAAAAVLGLAALSWWTVTADDRRLDAHVWQALERYEQAFAKDGVRAAPTPPPRDGYGPLLGVPSVEKVAVHEDGTTLTAEFIGGEVSGPCGADYTARAVESAHAALIVVEKHPHAREWESHVCPAVGYRRQVTVRLSRPLGGRTVLEAMRGMPVPLEQ
jgi:hypothetical protein